MIYLDNNATTKIEEKVFEVMRPFLTDHFGNPSSAYDLASASKSAIESARGHVADFLGAANRSEIVFTSGGTESDNWAILGTLEANPEKTKILTTRVEHEAVRKVCQKLESNGYDVEWINVFGDGTIDIEGLAEKIDRDTAIVSVMLANNETGVLFPVKEIAELVKSKSDALFHVDGVNAAGKIEIDLKNSGIDLFSISAHKFHGPKGVGALYVRDGVRIATNSIGGGQESGRRAGTEAIHQLVGLGEAARLASDLRPMDKVRELRDRFESAVLTEFSEASLNGHINQRLPNTSNISFENLNGEILLSMLNDKDIFVSTGSACNASDHVSSPVLRAMDVPYSKAMGAIRFSLGRRNTDADIDKVIEVLPGIVSKLRSLAN